LCLCEHYTLASGGHKKPTGPCQKQHSAAQLPHSGLLGQHSQQGSLVGHCLGFWRLLAKDMLLWMLSQQVLQVHPTSLEELVLCEPRVPKVDHVVCKWEQE
jgi:hypothetical protein